MTIPQYCPICGTPLGTKFEGGRERPACYSEDCGYLYFGAASIGCGGVVVRNDKALLVQRGINPGRGTWQIPGGYVEVDEKIEEAVQREVLEEAGVQAQVIDSLGFRHSTGTGLDRPANIYIVFRLEHISGEPKHDNQETLNAGFFSLDEMAKMDGVQNLSLWAIKAALTNPTHSGFTLDYDAFPMRDGWSLFGLKYPKL